MSRPSEDDVERLRSRVAELETLRARTVGLLAGLRTEQQQALEALADVQERYESLQSKFRLATEQLETLVFERAELEIYCHRLERSEREARERVIQTELTMHRELLAFGGESGSIAGAETRRFMASSPALTKTALEQLEALANELAVVSAQVSWTEHPVLRRIRLHAARLIARLTRSGA